MTLAEAGVESAPVDALYLAAHLMGQDVGEVRRRMVVGGVEAPEGYDDLVAERATRIPLQHLTGRAYFRGHVDLVTCNPPYIPKGQVPVDREVRDHDPELALYGGSADGLALPLAMAAHAATLLPAGGVLVMEHAETQGASLPRALAATGAWGRVIDHPDLLGRPRALVAVRAAETSAETSMETQEPGPTDDIGSAP